MVSVTVMVSCRTTVRVTGISRVMTTGAEGLSGDRDVSGNVSTGAETFSAIEVSAIGVCSGSAGCRDVSGNVSTGVVSIVCMYSKFMYFCTRMKNLNR